MKVLLLGDARVLANKIMQQGLGITTDPGDDIAATVSDVISCRFAPEGTPLLVLSTGSIADWTARQTRPDARFITSEEAVNELISIVPQKDPEVVIKANTSGNVFVLTYANKGGVGKTTTALSLALTLSAGGVPTVLCDFDYGGPDITGFFDLKAGLGIEKLLEGVPPDQLLVKAAENLYVLPGPVETHIPKITGMELLNAVKVLLAKYPVVLGDTPPDPWTKTNLHDVFSAADIVYAVVDQSKFSVQETEKYAPKLLAMGVSPERIRIIANRYNPKLTSIREMERSFCAGFKKGLSQNRLPRVVITVPEAWEEHVRAGYKGKLPISDKWTVAAKEVAAIAGMELESPPVETVKRGLFAWLRRR